MLQVLWKCGRAWGKSWTKRVRRAGSAAWLSAWRKWRRAGSLRWKFATSSPPLCHRHQLCCWRSCWCSAMVGCSWAKSPRTGGMMRPKASAPVCDVGICITSFWSMSTQSCRCWQHCFVIGGEKKHCGEMFASLIHPVLWWYGARRCWKSSASVLPASALPSSGPPMGWRQ